MTRIISAPKQKADKLETEINLIANFFELEKARTLRLRSYRNTHTESIEAVDERILAMQKEITAILLKYEGLMLQPRIERFNSMFRDV